MFTDENISILEKFIELSKYDGITLEAVAKMIGSTSQKINSHDVIEENEQKPNPHRSRVWLFGVLPKIGFI